MSQRILEAAGSGAVRTDPDVVRALPSNIKPSLGTRSWSRTTDSKMDNSIISTLPPEIRAWIFELVLCTNGPITVDFSKREAQLSSPPPSLEILAITRTCKQLRAESASFFWKGNTFRMATHALDLGPKGTEVHLDSVNMLVTHWHQLLHTWLLLIPIKYRTLMQAFEIDLGVWDVTHRSTSPVWAQPKLVAQFFKAAVKKAGIPSTAEFSISVQLGHEDSFTREELSLSRRRSRAEVDAAALQASERVDAWCYHWKPRCAKAFTNLVHQTVEEVWRST